MKTMNYKVNTQKSIINNTAMKPNLFNQAVSISLRGLYLSASILFCFITMSPAVSAQCDNINLACNNGVNVSINEDCYASIYPDLILESPPFATFPDNGMNYEITLTEMNGTPVTSAPNTVDQDYVGQTLKVSIELVPCGISCWGFVTIEDKIGPKIWNCVNGMLPEVTIECQEFDDAIDIPRPTVGGLCNDDPNNITFEDDTSAVNCFDDFALTILRTWIATDQVGNSTTCQQTIKIGKFDIDDVVIPADWVREITTDTECDEFNDLGPEVTGFPTGIFCPNIMFFYTDIVYPQCGRQMKLLRDWFVIDWCTGESVSQGQIIKLFDESAPISSCTIDTIKVAKNPKTCLATPILNPFMVAGFDTIGTFLILDACVEEITLEVGFLPAVPGTDQPIDGAYTIIDQATNGTYPLPRIEQAAWIRYCFEDPCGNSTKVDPDPDDDIGADNTCCYFEIQAVDDSDPVAVCEGFTKLPLLTGGLTEVPAFNFDDHSFDPCGEISHFLVKREQTSCPGFPTESTTFQESIHFCCADVGDTITIRLRVFDTDGNFAECLGLVCVEDQSTPSVVCMPPTVELECNADYTDRSVIGVPSGSNGCNKGIVVGDDVFDLKNYDLSCGTGIIKRTVVVRDISGKIIKTCTQDIIFDEDDNPTLLEEGDYVFPDNVTVDICDVGVSIDPSVTGIPTTTKTYGCTNIAITYEDDAAFVNNNSGLCYTIIRRWLVVDWCRYDPDFPNKHALRGVQEIKVTNTSVPTFNCPDDLTIEADAACEADYEFTMNVATTCNSVLGVGWTIDIESDGTINRSGQGLTFSGTFPGGTHTVVYSAQNDCGGNLVTCTFKFTVKGDKAPTPICLANVIWTLDADGKAEIWASDFNLKSEGGCDRNDDLIFSFVSPNELGYPQPSASFTCDDIPNGVGVTLPIVVYIVDESGNFSSCFATLQLQDTQDFCTDSGSMTIIEGEVMTEQLVEFENVMIELENMSNNDMTMDMTLSNGSYAFANVEFYNEYEVIPNNNEKHLNGVSTLDLVLIQRHILGQEYLDSPYKMIAADVDDSGNITAIDLIQLRKLILGIYQEFPENTSWVFIPEAHNFIDPLMPWGFPESLYIDQLYTAQEHANFVAVKVGDVNGSAVINKASEVEILEKRNNETFYIASNDDKIVKAGELVEVPFIADKDANILGIQFTLEFDHEGLLFEGMDGGKLNISQDNFALLNDVNGVITLSAHDLSGFDVKAGEVLFTAYFESRAGGQLSEMIELNSTTTKSEMYTLDEESKEVGLVFRDAASNEMGAMEVFQNEPNPFDQYTDIAFYIPNAQKVSLSIFDASGKVLLTDEKQFAKGINSFRVNGDQISSNGILIYRMESDLSSVTRKMMIVK